LKRFRSPFDLLKPGAAAAPSQSRIDIDGITNTINDALATAGLTAKSGVANGVMDTIQRALASAGLASGRSSHPASAVTIEGSAREVPAVEESDRGEAPPMPAVQDPAGAGEFVTRFHASAIGSRSYKLYVPSSYAQGSEERVPLVVMLHGCTQDPDDFAAGTQMNVLAERHGFIVAYPAQSANANGSRCWNWFRAQDQARDAGEPALIAGITREVAAAYRIDERRIFVAGLSAGAAMAVVLGVTYPDVYAAMGVHSGLPYASAHDVPSAFAAMHGGTQRNPRAIESAPAVPTIIFHGDRDATVKPSNADAIAAQVRAGCSADIDLCATVHTGITADGQSFTRQVLADGTNPATVELWILHGAGHAWSGGDARGSFTDPRGPDASAEMIRFFYAQRRAGSA